MTISETWIINVKQSSCDPLKSDVVLMWKWMLLGKRGTRFVLQPAVAPPEKEICNPLHLAWFGLALASVLTTLALMIPTTVMATRTQWRGNIVWQVVH